MERVIYSFRTGETKAIMIESWNAEWNIIACWRSFEVVSAKKPIIYFIGLKTDILAYRFIIRYI